MKSLPGTGVKKSSMQKILVVEDDKYLSGAYKVKLLKMGFEVRTAADGEEALVHTQGIYSRLNFAGFGDAQKRRICHSGGN